jgi:uncharacterized protein (TIGR02145 family)
MKTLTIVLMMALLTCLPISVYAQPYGGEKGDVNNDGIVNLFDVLKTVNIVLVIETPDNDMFWRADCNGSSGSCEGDGNVDLLDILKIVNIILDIDACPNTPPTASFTVDPTSGTTSTTFNVDASGCSDDQDPTSALQVRWDWENDGMYDTDWTTTKIASHQYPTNGTKTIKLEVKDTEGLTDSQTHQITVSCADQTVTDVDGNVYCIVTIGTQVWMAENLKVTHYRNGDPIPNVTDNTEWTGLSNGAYCNYDNDPGNLATYGCLYNWYAVNDSCGIAPAGWHVPTDAEWQTLVYYLGGSSYAGGKMKTTGTIEAGTGLWYSPNTGATNESSFSALPGGLCHRGYFFHLGHAAYFWSSTEYYSYYAWYRGLSRGYSGVYRYYYHKQNGFSVRCVRD